MKYINILVKANVTDNLYGEVSNEAWEKYLNGEMTLDDLYDNYFNLHDRIELFYDVTDVVRYEED